MTNFSELYNHDLGPEIEALIGQSASAIGILKGADLSTADARGVYADAIEDVLRDQEDSPTHGAEARVNAELAEALRDLT